MRSDEVGRELGIGANASSALLHRARSGLREAFLSAHPGAPRDSACARYWSALPALVRDVKSRRAEDARAHLATCPDGRGRCAELRWLNEHLAALVGPALLMGWSSQWLAHGTAGISAGGEQLPRSRPPCRSTRSGR